MIENYQPASPAGHFLLFVVNILQLNWESEIEPGKPSELTVTSHISSVHRSGLVSGLSSLTPTDIVQPNIVKLSSFKTEALVTQMEFIHVFMFQVFKYSGIWLEKKNCLKIASLQNWLLLLLALLLSKETSPYTHYVLCCIAVGMNKKKNVTFGSIL